MTKLIFWGAIVGLILGVAGCVSPQQQAAQKEDLLAAAGFQVKIADTPQRLAAMKRLPPNKFVTKVVNGQPVYLYADPLVCRCIYFGTQQNWAAYRQEIFAKQLADEALMTLGLNLAIGAALIALLLLARRRRPAKVGALSTSTA